MSVDRNDETRSGDARLTERIVGQARTHWASSLSDSGRDSVAPRCGFLPPRVHVAWLDSTTSDWSRLQPVALLTDITGVAASSRDVQIWLAHDGKRLHMRARGHDEQITYRPELAPDDPRFWMQDHIEFRLLPQPGKHQQFIVSLAGRCWDNHGLWKRLDEVSCSGTLRGRSWEVQLHIDAKALGLRELCPGASLRGIVAHVRWAEGRPDIACCSATQLGFSQEERFADLVLDGSYPDAPVLIGLTVSPDDQAELSFRNPTAGAVSGRLLLTREQAEGPVIVTDHAIDLSAGSSTVLRMPLSRAPRQFTRLGIAFVDASGARDLAAISMCGRLRPLPPPTKHQVHPYLIFDTSGLAEFRRKAASPFLRRLADHLKPKPGDESESHLPPPGGRFGFDFDADSMHWSRVARETMIRDGEGGRRPAAAHIWHHLTPAAQEVFRAVALRGSAEPTEISVLLDAFNALLRQRDFYVPSVFAHVRLPSEGERLIAKDVAELDEHELAKFNRILLQSSIECCHSFKMELAWQAGGYLPKWLATGERRWVDLATRTVRAAADNMISEATFHLHEGNIAPPLSLAYDAFHPLLNDSERRDWCRLLTQFLDLYLASARAGAWSVSAIPNANPVANAGAGFIALALWQEEPEKAREAIDWVRKYIWNWLDYCFGPDGGNTEGCQYWQYGTESWLRFAVLYERFFGRDDGLLDHPALRHSMNMVRVSLCNDGAMHGINDTIPTPLGAEIAWHAAGRYGDQFALWYGDHAERWFARAEEEGRPTPYRPTAMWGIHIRPDLPEAVAQPVPLPEAYALTSIEYGILRSGPQWDCQWTAGLKGSRPPYTHHNQPDTGACFIDLCGERLLIDPGYYKPQPTDHSLPLIDGTGPATPTGWTGRITDCRVIDDARVLTCDSTTAYGGAARRVVRHMVMLAQAAVIVLDDVEPTKAEALVTLQYQCGGKTTRLENDQVVIEGRSARMSLYLPHQRGSRITLHRERTLHDTHWGYHFAACRWFPVTIDLRHERGRPWLSVFTDASSKTFTSPEISCELNHVRIGFANGPEVVFRFTQSGWVLSSVSAAFPPEE